MTDAVKRYLITIDQLSDERREVIHELVKVKASGWWHNMPNVWIVAGLSHTQWRDELHPVINGTGASILVIELPDAKANRMWAFNGPNSSAKTKWLYEDYSGVKPRAKE